jgi:hypothetical protein
LPDGADAALAIAATLGMRNAETPEHPMSRVAAFFKAQSTTCASSLRAIQELQIR